MRKVERIKIVTTPNILTFIRIGVVPFLVISFFIESAVWSAISVTLFISASITDYFDGYIARKFQQVSKFGAFLDPIADKILIAVMLLMLAGTGRIAGLTLIPAVLIMCRELFISGLREFLSASGRDLPVSILAKYKTAIQMLSITCLLVKPLSERLFNIGIITIWIAAALTIITGVSYTVKGLSFMRKKGHDKGSQKVHQTVGR
jgi:cardiolipin synthase